MPFEFVDLNRYRIGAKPGENHNKLQRGKVGNGLSVIGMHTNTFSIGSEFSRKRPSTGKVKSVNMNHNEAITEGESEPSIYKKPR